MIRVAGSWGVEPWANDSSLDHFAEVQAALVIEPAYAVLREHLHKIPPTDLAALWTWIGEVYLFGESVGDMPVTLAEQAISVLDQILKSPKYAEFCKDWKSPAEIKAAIQFYKSDLERCVKASKNGFVYLLKVPMPSKSESKQLIRKWGSLINPR